MLPRSFIIVLGMKIFDSDMKNILIWIFAKNYKKTISCKLLVIFHSMLSDILPAIYFNDFAGNMAGFIRG